MISLQMRYGVFARFFALSQRFAWPNCRTVRVKCAALLDTPAAPISHYQEEKHQLKVGVLQNPPFCLCSRLWGGNSCRVR